VELYAVALDATFVPSGELVAIAVGDVAFANGECVPHRSTIPHATWCSDEQDMLKRASTEIDRIDPDVLIGHHLSTSLLDRLVARADEVHATPAFGRKTTRRRIACDSFVVCKEHMKRASYELPELGGVEDLSERDIALLVSSGNAGYSRIVQRVLEGAQASMHLVAQLDAIRLATKVRFFCATLAFAHDREVGRDKRIHHTGMLERGKIEAGGIRAGACVSRTEFRAA
jgi:hypothetical protein